MEIFTDGKKIGSGNNDWIWTKTEKKFGIKDLPFGKGEPNNINNKEDCMQIKTKEHDGVLKSYFNDISCEHKSSFLCQIKFGN